MLIFVVEKGTTEIAGACRDEGHSVIACDPYAGEQEHFAIIERCDGMMLGYRDDRLEAFAIRNEIPVFSAVPPLHPTEQSRPYQIHAFMRMIMKIYRLHLDKNADYSPANILATGSIGVTVRLWDKVARLMNLTGFKVEIAGSEYIAPLEPKNESIEDTLIDTANYAIIARLLRDGDWGN